MSLHMQCLSEQTCWQYVKVELQPLQVEVSLRADKLACLCDSRIQLHNIKVETQEVCVTYDHKLIACIAEGPTYSTCSPPPLKHSASNEIQTHNRYLFNYSLIICVLLRAALLPLELLKYCDHCDSVMSPHLGDRQSGCMPCQQVVGR